MNKRLVHVQLIGGLGNQLFQYAAALSRDPAKLVFETNLGSPRLNLELIPDIFDFELSQPHTVLKKRKFRKFFSRFTWYLIRFGMAPENFKTNFLGKKLISKVGSTLISWLIRRPTSLVLASDNGYFEMPSLKTNEYLLGFFQSYIWASICHIRPKLRQMNLKTRSDELKNFLNSQPKSNIVAIHVRLGDYRNEPGFGILQPSYYANALQRLNADESNLKYWLFSNEPDEAINFIPKEYRADLVVVPNFAGSAAETLEAMRNANSYILANSSLSWWGAFLSYQDDPVVITPQPWFQNNPEPSALIPQEWIRLNAWVDL